MFVVASLDRHIYALSREGEVLWRRKAVGPVYALAVAGGGQIAVGDDAGHVTLLDAQGQQLWRHEFGSRVTALLGGWQGGLLVGGWDERLTFLNAEATGARARWQVDLAGPVSGIATLPDPVDLRHAEVTQRNRARSDSGKTLAGTVEPLIQGVEHSSPSVSSLALVATVGGELRALDVDGTEVWRFDTKVPITGLGTLRGAETELVLVGLQDGRLLALDPRVDPSRLRWQHNLGLGGPIWHVANLVGDAEPEIVAGMGGTMPVIALLSADGDLLWRVATPAAAGAILTLDLDADGVDEILAGLASGEIQAYDSRGRLRGSIHAGLPVWGLEAVGDGTALALADVVAWQISGRAGPAGASWLSPPSLVPLPLGVGRASTPEDSGGEALLAFLGDVALGRSMEAQLIRYGAEVPWGGLEPLVRGADLAVANLECVLTTKGRPLDKPYLIRAHPRWAQTLAEAGLDLVTLANNHAFDFGPVGLDETLATLKALRIDTVGASPSTDIQQAHRPALFNLNGVRVAILGYAAARWHGSQDVPATERIAWAQPEAVQDDVRSVRDQADLVVVLLHAGTEYAAEPSPDQVAVAHAAVDAGADLVVGHHPHVTQTVERYGQGLIVYSLGDTVFDIPRPAAMQGDLLRIRVTKEGLAQAELWPFWIEDGIRPRLLDDGSGAPYFKIVYP